MKRWISIVMAICLIFGTIQPVMATGQSAAQGSGKMTLVCLPDYEYQANVDWIATHDGVITLIIATYEDESCRALSDATLENFVVKQGENKVYAKIKDADSVMAKSFLLKGDGTSLTPLLPAAEMIYDKTKVQGDILCTETVANITTSIQSRNEEYHPATAMIDGVMTGDAMFKSEAANGYDNTDNVPGVSKPLTITVNLKGAYELSMIKIYERYLSSFESNVVSSVKFGFSGDMTTVAENVVLNTGNNGAIVSTTVNFNARVIGDTIEINFAGGLPQRGDGGESQYQIWELEAFGEKAVIQEDILSTETVDSITTSIQSRNEEYHPATAMLDGAMSGDAMFKSEAANGYDNTEDVPGVSKPLTIAVNLKDTYKLNKLKIYENYLSSFASNVISSVKFGIRGDMTTVAENVTLNTGDNGAVVTTTINFSAIVIGDTIEINFAGGLPERGDGGESQYQIWELEAFGEAAELVLPLDMDFEYYDGAFSGYPVVAYNSSKALEVAASSQEQTVKIDALIPGDFAISFDIAVDGAVQGELSVEGGGNPAFVLSFNEDTTISTYQNNINIANYGPDYKNISMVYDSKECVFDIYADENMVADNYDSGSVYFDKCVTFTFKFKGVGADDKVYLDNLLAYPTYMKTDKCHIYDPTAQKPDWDKEIVLTGESYIETESDTSVLPDGCVSVHMRSGVMYADGEKSILDNLPYWRDDEIMVPVDVFTNGLNMPVYQNGDDVLVGDTVSVTVGVQTMRIGQQEYQITAGPEEKDGILYLPLRAIAETGFSKSVFVEDEAIHSGMVIISDDNFGIPEGLVHELSFDATLRNDEHAYFYLSNEKSRTNLGVHFEAKKIVHADDSIATVYKTNWTYYLWTNIKFVYDTQTDIVDIYVGGSKVDSYPAGLNKEFYGVFLQTSDGANAYIDNVNYTVKRKYGTDASVSGDEQINVYSRSDFPADVFSATDEKQLDNMFYHVKGESKGSSSLGNPGSSFKLGTEGYLTLKNVLSENDVNISGDELQLTNDFCFYFRPSKEQWLADYNASELKGVHPRVMATAEDFARIREEIKTNSIKRNWYNSLIYHCDNEFMLEPTVKYELRDGVRLLYVADEFSRYMMSLAMAYQLTGDEKYFEAAWKHIEAVATMPDWNPIHHIDVGTMATGYAVAYDWFYDVMTQEQRQIMERGIYNNLFWIVNEAYKNPDTIYGDVRMEDNHNVFCNAGIMASCIAFMDVYPDVGSHIAANTLRSLEYFMDKFAPLGAYYEGIDYATVAVDFTARLFAAMEPTMGTLYGIDKAEGFNLSADYMSNLQSDVASFNFADGDPGMAKAPGVFWIYDHYNITGKKDIIAQTTLNAPYGEDAVFCLLWYSAKEEEADSDAALDVYYPGEEIITMRNSYASGQVFAGIKAGDTLYTHSHLDSGSFIFDANGKRWAYDLGKDDYNLEYKYGFYDIFRRRPEAHNTLLINPDESEGYVLGSRADVISYESEAGGVIAKIDMTDLYGVERNVSDAKRGYFFTDDRQSLVVRDEVTFTADSQAYWLMYIDSNASVSGNTVILTDKNNSNKKLKIEFLSNYDGDIVIEDAVPFPASPQIPEQNQNEGYSRLYFKVSAAAGEMEITAKLTPLNMGVAESDIENYHTDMNNWVIAGNN